MISIGGLTPFSTTDFPHCAASVLFLQGCPWRCGYCHNPSLRRNLAPDQDDWRLITSFLDSRKNLIDAVVFSGGEPTMHRLLPRAIDEVRRRGYRVGLHTAGIYPGRLARLLPRLDWVGLDVKACFDDYPAVVGRQGSAASVRESLDLVIDSGVDYEVRTTWHPALYGRARLVELARSLARRGVQRFVLQEFRATGCADHALVHSGEPVDDALAGSIGELFPSFEVRRAGVLAT